MAVLYDYWLQFSKINYENYPVSNLMWIYKQLHACKLEEWKGLPIQLNTDTNYAVKWALNDKKVFDSRLKLFWGLIL